MRPVAWLAAAGALACAPEDPPREIPPVTWAGAYLEYAPQEGAIDLCAGTLPYMDRYVQLAAEAMDVELEQPVVYVLGSEDAETFCENEVLLGCTFRDSVYARVAPQEHELVHGVRAAYGFSHLFFEEGAAEAFGDDAAMSMRVPAHGDLLEGLASATFERGLPIHWYPRAGHFAAFLHEQYGPEVTMALLQQTDASSSAARAVAVIEQTTGVPFEATRQAYALEPSCGQAQYRYPLYACDEPAALRARCDASVAATVTIACNDPTTLGPRDGEIWKYLALEVVQDGEYLVTALHAATSNSPLELKECALGCGSILHKQGHGLGFYGITVRLRAGRYSLKLLRPEDSPGEIEVTVAGRSCSRG